MNELKNQKSVPLPKGDGLRSEAASMNQLLGMLNNPALTGAEVPEGETEAVKVHPNLRRIPTPDAAAPSLSASEPAARAPRAPVLRLFLTGTMGVGKDYVALAAESQVIGFADPIYTLVNVLFPGISVSSSSGKDIPGVRETMQALGQWGRGDIGPKYPLTPARAMMIAYVRQLAKSNVFDPALCVDWDSFGANNNIWLDSLVERAKRLDPARRVAATNVRFEHEFKRLQSEGWTHYHVMCSSATRHDRLRKIGVAPNAPALTDTSEKLAMALDVDVQRKMRQIGGANRLRVIWNDIAKPPSPRVYLLDQWLQEIAITEAVPAIELPAASSISLE